MWDITAYGAVGDGKTVSTEAVQRTIDLCHEAGGGTVYFPAGSYLSGSLLLRSNVTLYLDGGVVLLGSDKVRDYPLKHLLYAEDAENIAVAGTGCIDGQGAAFWATGQELRPENVWRKGWGRLPIITPGLWSARRG